MHICDDLNDVVSISTTEHMMRINDDTELTNVEENDVLEAKMGLGLSDNVDHVENGYIIPTGDTVH